MANKSLSIALIMNTDDDDLFNVIVDDPDQDMLVDVTEGYEVSSATLPDGRIGVVIVAKVEQPSPPVDRINPFDMPGQEDL